MHMKISSDMTLSNGNIFRIRLVHCEGNPPVTGGSPHKSQWRGALMVPLICAWTNDRVNNRDAGDLGRHRPHIVFKTNNRLLWRKNWRWQITWVFNNRNMLGFLSGRTRCRTQRTCDAIITPQHRFDVIMTLSLHRVSLVRTSDTPRIRRWGLRTTGDPPSLS